MRFMLSRTVIFVLIFITLLGEERAGVYASRACFCLSDMRYFRFFFFFFFFFRFFFFFSFLLGVRVYYSLCLWPPLMLYLIL